MQSADISLGSVGVSPKATEACDVASLTKLIGGRPRRVFHYSQLLPLRLIRSAMLVPNCELARLACIPRSLSMPRRSALNLVQDTAYKDLTKV